MLSKQLILLFIVLVLAISVNALVETSITTNSNSNETEGNLFDLKLSFKTKSIPSGSKFNLVTSSLFDVVDFSSKTCVDPATSSPVFSVKKMNTSGQNTYLLTSVMKTQSTQDVSCVLKTYVAGINGVSSYVLSGPSIVSSRLSFPFYKASVSFSLPSNTPDENDRLAVVVDVSTKMDIDLLSSRTLHFEVQSLPLRTYQFFSGYDVTLSHCTLPGGEVVATLTVDATRADSDQDIVQYVSFKFVENVKSLASNSSLTCSFNIKQFGHKRISIIRDYEDKLLIFNKFTYDFDLVTTLMVQESVIVASLASYYTISLAANDCILIDGPVPSADDITALNDDVSYNGLTFSMDAENRLKVESGNKPYNNANVIATAFSHNNFNSEGNRLIPVTSCGASSPLFTLISPVLSPSVKIYNTPSEVYPITADSKSSLNVDFSGILLTPENVIEFSFVTSLTTYDVDSKPITVCDTHAYEINDVKITENKLDFSLVLNPLYKTDIPPTDFSCQIYANFGDSKPTQVEFTSTEGSFTYNSSINPAIRKGTIQTETKIHPVNVNHLFSLSIDMSMYTNDKYTTSLSLSRSDNSVIKPGENFMMFLDKTDPVLVSCDCNIVESTSEPDAAVYTLSFKTARSSQKLSVQGVFANKIFKLYPLSVAGNSLHNHIHLISGEKDPWSTNILANINPSSTFPITLYDEASNTEDGIKIDFDFGIDVSSKTFSFLSSMVLTDITCLDEATNTMKKAFITAERANDLSTITLFSHNYTITVGTAHNFLNPLKCLLDNTAVVSNGTLISFHRVKIGETMVTPQAFSTILPSNVVYAYPPIRIDTSNFIPTQYSFISFVVPAVLTSNKLTISNFPPGSKSVRVAGCPGVDPNIITENPDRSITVSLTNAGTCKLYVQMANYDNSKLVEHQFLTFNLENEVKTFKSPYLSRYSIHIPHLTTSTSYLKNVYLYTPVKVADYFSGTPTNNPNVFTNKIEMTFNLPLAKLIVPAYEITQVTPYVWEVSADVSVAEFILEMLASVDEDMVKDTVTEAYPLSLQIVKMVMNDKLADIRPLHLTNITDHPLMKWSIIDRKRSIVQLNIKHDASMQGFLYEDIASQSFSHIFRDIPMDYANINTPVSCYVKSSNVPTITKVSATINVAAPELTFTVAMPFDGNYIHSHIDASLICDLNPGWFSSKSITFSRIVQNDIEDVSYPETAILNPPETIMNNENGSGFMNTKLTVISQYEVRSVTIANTTQVVGSHVTVETDSPDLVYEIVRVGNDTVVNFEHSYGLYDSVVTTTIELHNNHILFAPDFYTYTSYEFYSQVQSPMVTIHLEPSIVVSPTYDYSETGRLPITMYGTGLEKNLHLNALWSLPKKNSTDENVLPLLHFNDTHHQINSGEAVITPDLDTRGTSKFFFIEVPPNVEGELVFSNIDQEKVVASTVLKSVDDSAIVKVFGTDLTVNSTITQTDTLVSISFNLRFYTDSVKFFIDFSDLPVKFEKCSTFSLSPLPAKVSSSTVELTVPKTQFDLSTIVNCEFTPLPIASMADVHYNGALYAVMTISKQPSSERAYKATSVFSVYNAPAVDNSVIVVNVKDTPSNGLSPNEIQNIIDQVVGGCKKKKLAICDNISIDQVVSGNNDSSYDSDIIIIIKDPDHHNDFDTDVTELFENIDSIFKDKDYPATVSPPVTIPSNSKCLKKCGGDCGLCAAGQPCAFDSDCISSVCKDNVCEQIESGKDNSAMSFNLAISVFVMVLSVGVYLM